MTEPAEPRQEARTLVRALVISGIITLVAGIVLGMLDTPALFAVAAVGLGDLLVAWLLSSGRVGPLRQARAAAEASGDTATEAELDPSYNPYATED